MVNFYRKHQNVIYAIIMGIAFAMIVITYIMINSFLSIGEIYRGETWTENEMIQNRLAYATELMTIIMVFFSKVKNPYVNYKYRLFISNFIFKGAFSLLLTTLIIKHIPCDSWSSLIVRILGVIMNFIIFEIDIIKDARVKDQSNIAMHETKLKSIMFKRKMDNIDLEKKSGVNKIIIGALQSGEFDINQFSTKTVAKLAAALDCTIEDLLEDNN